LKGVGNHLIQSLNVPTTEPRHTGHLDPAPLSEIRLERPGWLPVRVVVPTSEVNQQAGRLLERQLIELPRLLGRAGRGAIDIKLEDQTGEHHKGGTVVIEGPDGPVSVAIDPITRRFRIGDLVPGEYQVRAASAGSGRGRLRLTVREGDVARAAIRLDGEPIEGTATVRLTLGATTSETVHVRAKDKLSGAIVFDDVVQPDNGIIELHDIPIGKIHWDVDDESMRGC